MRFPRSCGTLLHPTSLPSPYGTGDLGPSLTQFLDFLHDTWQSIWQVLPLCPTGYGNSPYASYSAFAGNPYLVSPEILVKKGLLTKAEAESSTLPSGASADYERSYPLRDSLYQLAYERFRSSKTPELEKRLAKFEKDNAYWLEDFTLFMAIGRSCGFRPWNQWDADLAQRKPAALKAARKEHQREIGLQTWLQFEFSEQWGAVKSYANQKGIRIIGDIPIFVDHNSADVWSHPEFFAVDKKGNRTHVAGVPPDYFSATGQLWGNPQYKWAVLKKDGYSWWVERFSQMFKTFDAIRVDHFRGFDAYWQVDAKEKTAEKGKWVKGPGASLFETIEKALGEIPIIAEDLGFVTEGVEKLRDRFNFPGMKILQFAFDSDATNSFLPHNFPQNCVVYTGTHDNDTSLGWYASAPEIERHRVREYTRSDGREIHWELIRLGMFSVADQAIFPLQDFMNLGGEFRMNLPGTVGSNWLWRYTTEMLASVDRQRIRHLVEQSNRRQA